MIKEEMDQETNIIKDTVVTYSQHFKACSLSLDQMKSHLDSLERLISEITNTLYASYVNSCLNVYQSNTYFCNNKTICNHLLFSENNEIYITVMKALRNTHIPVLRLLRAKSTQLAGKTALEMQVSEKYCLNKSRPY